MSNGVVKQGLRQQQRSLSERLTSLEQGVMRLTMGLNEKFQQDGPRLTSVEEQVSALVELAGPEEVTKVINERRIERMHAQADAEKASLEEGIKDGYVTTAEKIDEKSLIVGRYTDAKGEIVEPGRAQLIVPAIQPQFKEKLLGGAVGLTLDLPDGGKFEVQEIYFVDEAKANEVMEAKKAAAEAAAKAASATASADEAKDTAPAAEAPTESEPTA